MMRHRIAWLALPIAVAVAGFSYYHQVQETGTRLRQADAAVDALYRNRTRALPAVHLTTKQITTAKNRLKALTKAPLTPHQAANFKTAQADLDSAAKMLQVTHATQAPVTTDNTYTQEAQAALAAYETLTTNKPLFTQVYQQPVTTLHDKAAAVDAVDALQAADTVTPEAIADTKDALAKVPVADPEFKAQAQAVVESATDKLPQQTETPNTQPTAADDTPADTLQAATTTTATPTTVESTSQAAASSSSASAASVAQPATKAASASSSAAASSSAE